MITPEEVIKDNLYTKAELLSMVGKDIDEKIIIYYPDDKPEDIKNNKYNILGYNKRGKEIRERINEDNKDTL